MKLALNFSHPAADLLRSGAIDFDYFKTPAWPDLISQARQQRPVAVHFDLKAGQGQIDGRSWEEIDTILADTPTRYVNLHLTPTLEHFPDIRQDDTSPAQLRRVAQEVIEEVGCLAEHFGASRVIVENIPYRGAASRWLRLSVEPELIWEVVEQTGCGLLLDISHARIAAHHLGWDAHDYMCALPVEHLRELHFTGLQRINGRLQDHLAAQPEDWGVLEWVLEQVHRGKWARPHMLAFEYGGVGGFFSNYTDPAVIREQVPRLFDLLKRSQESDF
jgi:uncharacterized protein (UPF0276 family)